MAKSLPLDISLTRGSDMLTNIYCEPCNDADETIKLAVGYCHDCIQNLCVDCYTAHIKNKASRNHKLIDKSNASSTTPQQTCLKSVREKCLMHKSEIIRSYCKSCDQLLCKICETHQHQDCYVHSITAAAINIKGTQEVKDLHKKLKNLHKRFNDNLIEIKQQVTAIELLYTDAINDINKLREQFEKLLTETKRQAESLKNDDLKKMESISKTCELLSDQINNISLELETKEANEDNECFFISMKFVETQLKPLEENLIDLNNGKAIHQYKFEPHQDFEIMLNGMNLLGKFSFADDKSTLKRKPILKRKPTLKTAEFLKDIDIRSSSIRGSVMLPNQQLILTNHYNKVTLIDTIHDKLIYELHLPNQLWDVTKIKSDEVAIACCDTNKIQFVSVFFNTMTKGKEIEVNGSCRGIDYNDQDQSLIVSFQHPPKVEILTLSGTVLKSLIQDANMANIFACPLYVALSPEKNAIFVSDMKNNSVTLITLDGKIKTVYKDSALRSPAGIRVSRSRVVYVVGFNSHTLHQILPNSSDSFETLLEHNDGLVSPHTITYCESEDKIYVGQNKSSSLKVFQIK